MTGHKHSEITRRYRPWYSPPLVFSLLVILFLGVEAVAAVNSEGQALLAFKAGLRDPQGVLNSWSSADSDPCKWYGVTCDTNYNVHRVLIQGTELSGNISARLRDLPVLRALVLSRNNFSGIIPPELAEIGTRGLNFPVLH